MSVTLGIREFFSDITQIKYEGTESDNPISFRWYDENKVVVKILLTVLFNNSKPTQCH